MSVLRQQLSDTQSQLEATAKTLAKEQGKNRSAAQHKQVRVCRVPLSASRYVSVECRSAQAGTCLQSAAQRKQVRVCSCLLYTSDAADER